MKYIYTLFIICLSYLSISAQDDILMQDGTFNQCSGTFFDSGGPTGDYQNGEEFTLTICPDDPSLQTILEFTTFQLSNDGADQITIYDANTADPAFEIGTFTGTLAENPELNLIAASNANASGCLTIVFVSPNTFFIDEGWEAAISCRPPCQTITPELVSISPICNVDNSGQEFVEVNQPITFEADATTSSGETDDLTYEWDFNGAILTGQSVDQTFTNPGDVDVTLTVTDSFGCFETLDFTITVGDSTILVDDNQFALNELINQVLISGTCSIVENITSPNNASSSGDPFESFGYFNQACSTFPFEEGIIMATTNINSALNTNVSGGSFNWPGDPDLEALIQEPGNTNNATVIEFEFTPFVDKIEFNYIFTSYEYPEFVCQFADTFAFILSGPGISDVNDYDHDADPNTDDVTLDLGGLNIALVPDPNTPGTFTNTPVSPVNVHNETCTSGQGENAFSDFYDVDNSLPNTPGDILVDGRTKKLTAQADVIPGQVYTIKLAIADRGDAAFDSFVFLEGGSFELGANVGEDLVIDDFTAACEGDVITLEVFDGVAPPGFVFQWTQDGVPIAGETGPTLDVTETGEYCIELEAGTDCDDLSCVQVEFVPVFDETEDITENLDLTVCLPFSDPASFDLTQNDNPILDNIRNTFFNDFPDFQTENPDVEPYQVIYYETAQDAIDGTNPILDPSNFIPNPQNFPFTIHYAVTNTLGLSCLGIGTGSFEIDVTTSIVGDLEDLSECSDVPGSDVATFDLTDNDANVLNGEDPDNFEVSYYESQQDAIDGTNPIQNPSAYQNTSNPQTIWANQNNLESSACFDVGSFQLEVFQTPEITIPPQDLSQCGDFTLTQTFDLTENDETALGILNPADTQLTYHNTQADADAGTNPIPTPTNYQPGNQQENIFIRAENINNSDCFTTDSFVIEIFDVEILPPDDLGLCDDGSGTGTASFNLTENNFVVLGPNQSPATHSVSYHESLADANGGSSPIPDPTDYTNTSNPQTIWVRVQNIGDPDCFEVDSFELSVTDSAPVNLDPPDIVECDDDNDGFFNNFDLSSQDDVINFGNPDIVVTYHLTQSDANNNVGALSSPYANVVESVQVIYFRTEDINNGCELFGSFELQVVDSPLLTSIEDPLSACDDNTDGFLFFDLTQIEPEVLGGLDPTELDITYHLTQTDAEDNLNAIAQPTNYQNISNPQTIWVRVTDVSNAQGCFNIEPFEIEVLPLPDIVNAEPLEVCDDETGGDLSDEIATFDLNDKIDEITQGNNELDVEFFETPADLANDNPITPIDAYVNISNPQTIEVRVTSQTTGCEAFSNLTLVVNPIPSLDTVLEPLEVCDPDNDGFGEFDLASAIIDILNGEPEVTITFHLTQADADLGVNPIDISEPFGTNNPGQQTIYVRAENTGPNGDDGTGCFDTRPLDLIVIPSPEIQDLEDLVRCDDDTPNGFASFDLTVNTPLALGSQDGTNIDITYHETQQQAEDGTDAIAVPSNYTNITNPQTIYVRIEDTETGCVDLFDFGDDINNTFTLTVEPLPDIITPSILEVCDDDDNQDPFPQTTFDLTVKELEIVGEAVVPANLEFTYYESQADLDNDNPIADPTNYVNISQPQNIFVKVIDTDTQEQCFDSVIMTISVLPLPSPSETDPDVLRLEGCDDDNDGIANEPFDLTESGNLIAGSENVDISYYTTESGAETEDAIDLIATPEAYVNDPSLNETDENGNPTNIQIIYARVDNAVAGNFCFVIVPFELIVYPAPVLNPDGNPFAYTLCEDTDANPGIATIFSTQDITDNLWDLTGGSSDVIIPLLDPDTIPSQNIDDFTVTFHQTEVEAEDGINAISPGYQATDGEVLFIRVVNLTTECFNTDAIGQVELQIQPRPDIADTNPDDIVICADEVANPGVATVDLTQQDEVINPGEPANTMVVYYEGMMDFNNATPIDDPINYQTSQSPQTIIAEVVNTETLCESSSFVSFDIIINALPNVDISGFDGAIVCIDQNGEVIITDDSPPIIDTGLDSDNFTFEWTLDGIVLPDTTPSVDATQPGTYTVTVTDNITACEASSSASIIENNPPTFEVTVLTPAFSQSHVVEVSNINGSGNFEFQLDDGQWVSLEPGQTTLVFSNVAQGAHVMNGRDDESCGVNTVTFTIIGFPPFFTPNQDGFNETWNITGLSNQPNAKIYIFDRYGKLLKQLSPGGEGWDGTFNGKNMPSQDYWFRVEFNEPTTDSPSTFKSHFTLKR